MKIRGTIDIDDSVEPADTTIPIKIDNINKVLPYKNKAYVDLQKNLSGDITFINGEMYQTYEVTMTSKDGEVLINEFLDTPGNKLNSVSDVTIVENTATELTGLTVGSSYTMSELQAALQNKKLDEGKVLRFQYSYKIDNSAYEAGTVDSAYTNTASVTYNGLTEPVTDTAMPEINKPTIEKTSGELVEQAGKKGFEWTISIKLNDFKTADLNQLDIQLSDTLGAGLVNQGATNAIDFNDFTYSATTDTYEYKYFTEITQEYADSVSRKEATNEVTMTLKHPITGVPYTYENTGTGVVPGRNWINKTASSYDSASRTVTWEIKLENIPAGIRSVRVYDTVYNGLDITNTTIRVKDPNGVEKLLCENGVAVDNEFGYLDSISAANNRAIVKLYDGFVNNNVGKDVYIYVTSKLPDVITDAYNQSTFVNIAQLWYLESGTQYTFTARAEFKDTSNCVDKTGAAVPGEAAMNYNIFVDMTKLDIIVGDTIYIKDILPEGVVIDKNIANGKEGVVSKYINRRNNYDGGGESTKVFINDLSDKLTVVENDGEVDVSITVDQTLYNSWLNDRHNGVKDRRAIWLSYKTYVEDESAFVRNGQVVTYTNYVTGTHNGNNIGTAECPIELTPQSAVDKALDIPDSNKNIAKYTIEVNEDKLDLSDGMLLGKDVLGRGLAYKLDNPSYPITVEKKLDNGTWQELEEAVDYTYIFYTEENALEFRLPDETHLRISYYADINIRREEYWTESLATNVFSLEGIRDFPQSGMMRLPRASVEPISWVDYTIGEIELYKYWNNNGTLTALPGTKFALYDTVATASTLELGNLLRDDIEVDAQGKAVINNLNVDRIYALLETEVAVGFERIDEPYYFILPGSHMQTIPAGYNVQYFINGSTLYFENRKVDTGYLNVTKNLSGLTDWSQLADKVEFVISRNGVENYRIRGTELDSITHSKQIEVNVGTYEVKEIITLPEGYVCETTYSVNASPAQTGVAANVQVNAGATTALVFQNTYAPAPTVSSGDNPTVTPAPTANPGDTVTPGDAVSGGGTVSPGDNPTATPNPTVSPSPTEGPGAMMNPMPTNAPAPGPNGSTGSPSSDGEVEGVRKNVVEEVLSAIISPGTGDDGIAVTWMVFLNSCILLAAVLRRFKQG